MASQANPGVTCINRLISSRRSSGHARAGSLRGIHPECSGNIRLTVAKQHRLAVLSEFDLRPSPSSFGDRAGGMIALRRPCLPQGGCALLGWPEIAGLELLHLWANPFEMSAFETTILLGSGQVQSLNASMITSRIHAPPSRCQPGIGERTATALASWRKRRSNESAPNLTS